MKQINLSNKTVVLTHMGFICIHTSCFIIYPRNHGQMVIIPISHLGNPDCELSPEIGYPQNNLGFL
jgi:NAD-specific glutamate dehydrogenase